MTHFALRVFVTASTLRQALKEESGQDMVEYAIVMGLIALGATVAMNGLATTIAAGFTSVGTKVAAYTT